MLPTRAAHNLLTRLLKMPPPPTRLAFAPSSGALLARAPVAALTSSTFRGAPVAATARRLSASAAPLRAAPVAVAAAPAAPTDRAVGDVVSGFRLARTEYIADVSSLGRIWTHEKTGAEIISVSNGDENKCMSVVFRTPPDDSRGTPHVLEHSVLCGSRKYPVKEPFVELIRTSLNTFLNAMTSSAWTAYPVASCNEQDFYNLVDVYLDAVFHPNLTPDTLAQEGWSYQLEEGGKKEDVKISGVVRNEMVGAYTGGERILGISSQRVLYPDTTYGVESGGHPRDIPDLTWEQFKDFHDRFYHPSNARIFFYGDDAEEKRLAKADEFLGEFDRKVVDSEIKLQTKWDKPREFEFTYDAGSGDVSNKFMATVNWGIMDTPVDKFDEEELMALSIANHVLLAMSSSPLRKALTDSKLGEDVVGGGLDTDTRQMNFSIGLKGMKKEAVPKMEALVEKVLADAAKNGFPKEVVDASLNSIEFRLRENNTGGFPKGLSMLFRSVTNWILDADPFEALKFEDAISKLRARLDKGEPVFQNVIQKYIVDNTHRAVVTLRPDPTFAQTEIEVEKKRISDAVSGMSEADLQKIVDDTKRLKAKQSAPDDPKELAKIPRLGRKDLEKKTKIVPYDRYDEKNVMVLHHPQPTNGVVYLDMCFDMSHVPTELLPLMSVFIGAMTELGTKKRDFVALQQEIARTTGGISSSTYVSQVFAASGDGPAVSKLTLRGKGMVGQVPALLDLMREVVMDVDVNNKTRIQQLLLEERASLESGIAGSGHQVAMGRLGAMFRKTGALDEAMGGIDFLTSVKDLIKRVDKDWASVSRDMKTILASCVSRDGMVVNVTTASDDFKAVRPAVSAFLDNIPAEPVTSGSGWVDSIGLVKRRNEGLIVPSGVNYVGKAVNLADMGFEVSGGHSLASKALGTSYLWDRVRVQGGAYGGFCRLDARTGGFVFASYRDPNVKATCDEYDGASAFLKNQNLSDEQITSETIGMIGALDSYQLPDGKGFASTLRVICGDSDEMRQERRDQVLSATNKDFHELGEMLECVKESGTVVVVGGEEALKQAQNDGLDLELMKVV